MSECATTADSQQNAPSAISAGAGSADDCPLFANAGKLSETENSRLTSITKSLCDFLRPQSVDQRINSINFIKQSLHEISPMKGEPVDCVVWVPFSSVVANDYNPNSVAPPEMELLRVSINEDGYTQPIVAWQRDDAYEVIDGFHRNRVGRECREVTRRIHGYLPLSVVNVGKTERGSRIASTIRHNRARGKHAVSAMSDIVVELKRRNWADEKISRELGMDQDEILRLCQISGLAEMFSDADFSASWDVVGSISEDDIAALDEDLDEVEMRVPNTSDPLRIFHPHELWECEKAGFYKSGVKGLTKKSGAKKYAEFLSDDTRFRVALAGVITEWKHSCEHYLTNVAMNRIAWLGQAAACYATGLPAEYRSGFGLLSESQQETANRTALEFLNKWMVANGRSELTMEEAIPDRQSEIY